MPLPLKQFKAFAKGKEKNKGPSKKGRRPEEEDEEEEEEGEEHEAAETEEEEAAEHAGDDHHEEEEEDDGDEEDGDEEGDDEEGGGEEDAGAETEAIAKITDDAAKLEEIVSKIDGDLDSEELDPDVERKVKGSLGRLPGGVRKALRALKEKTRDEMIEIAEELDGAVSDVERFGCWMFHAAQEA